MRVCISPQLTIYAASTRPVIIINSTYVHTSYGDLFLLLSVWKTTSMWSHNVHALRKLSQSIPHKIQSLDSHVCNQPQANTRIDVLSLNSILCWCILWAPLLLCLYGTFSYRCAAHFLVSLSFIIIGTGSSQCICNLFACMNDRAQQFYD